MIAFRWSACAAGAALAFSNVSALAQTGGRGEPRASVTANSSAENYLRLLQLIGVLPPHQWSIRSLSRTELRALTPVGAHPLSALDSPRDTSDRFVLTVLPATLRSWYNSTYPTGGNDGAVWRGRGLTAAIDGGVDLAAGPVFLTLAPEVFWTENRGFPLMPNGLGGALVFANGQIPTQVDFPQRFGADSYARLDPGQSTLRVEKYGVTAGVSTANQWWGPMTELPFVLGNNAAGFPNVFAGTSRPVNVWIGDIHFRQVFGDLSQSAFTSIADSAQRRFVSGLIAVFTPRGAPGLELGGTRFFQGIWPERGITGKHVFLPWRKGFSKVKNAEDPDLPSNPFEDVYNQLGSLFARWVFAPSGVEIYGELGREDNSWNTRDLILEPDHSATLGLGVRKGWRAGDEVRGIGAEWMNARFGNIKNRGGLGSFYIHHIVRQGHTHHGQLLGAPAGIGSFSATAVTYESIGAARETRLRWYSRVRRDFRLNAAGPLPQEPDVMHGLVAERTMRRDRMDITYGVGAHYDFNRDFGGDQANAEFFVGVRRR